MGRGSAINLYIISDGRSEMVHIVFYNMIAFHHNIYDCVLHFMTSPLGLAVGFRSL